MNEMARVEWPAATPTQAGEKLRQRLATRNVLPAIGIYDAFSASIAARYFDALFCSGYGFSASYFGLPDEGYITWTDLLHYVEQVRYILPGVHLVVDIDDGHGDANIAVNLVRRLGQIGASAVIFEDQKHPKQCGHLPGKQISDLEDYLSRLRAVLAASNGATPALAPGSRAAARRTAAGPIRQP